MDLPEGLFEVIDVLFVFPVALCFAARQLREALVGLLVVQRVEEALRGGADVVLQADGADGVGTAEVPEDEVERRDALLAVDEDEPVRALTDGDALKEVVGVLGDAEGNVQVTEERFERRIFLDASGRQEFFHRPLVSPLVVGDDERLLLAPAGRVEEASHGSECGFTHTFTYYYRSNQSLLGCNQFTVTRNRYDIWSFRLTCRTGWNVFRAQRNDDSGIRRPRRLVQVGSRREKDAPRRRRTRRHAASKPYRSRGSFPHPGGRTAHSAALKLKRGRSVSSTSTVSLR